MNQVEPSDYHEQSRPEVAAMVPQRARRVLDVGCGFGGLGRHLAVTRGCEMHGIEYNPEARARLAPHYSRFEIADAQSAWRLLAGETYDCIIFADILEHLVDPWEALKGYRTLLAPGGAVVASIPNVRNFALLYDLVVRGRWRYAGSGLLDRTHLRFFTRREIEDLFAQAGLAIEAWSANRDHFTGIRRVAAASAHLFVPDLTVCQFVVRASGSSR